MKSLHICAVACFALAFLMYLAAGWVPGAAAAGLLGVIFEGAAWISWISSIGQSSDPKE